MEDERERRRENGRGKRGEVGKEGRKEEVVGGGKKRRRENGKGRMQRITNSLLF